MTATLAALATAVRSAGLERLERLEEQLHALNALHHSVTGPAFDGNASLSWVTWGLIGLVIVFWAFVMFGANFLALAIIDYRYANPPKPICTSIISSSDLPGVSILRPLKGVEGDDPEEMFLHLATCMKQEYPRNKFEVAFSVADEDDPVIPVIQKLMKAYPDVDARLIIGGMFCLIETTLLMGQTAETPPPPGDEPLGANPKVCNLSIPYRTAKHPILWILDSNVHFASSNTLARAVDNFLKAGASHIIDTPLASSNSDMVSPSSTSSTSAASPTPPLRGSSPHPFFTSPPSRLSPLIDSPYTDPPNRIGLVHHLPVPSHPGRDLGSLLETVWLSTAHAKFYTLINHIRIGSCVCGKSHAYWREDLETETDGAGVREFAGNLAEDNAAARRIWDKGVRHAIAPDLALQSVRSMTLRQYVSRRARWARVRKYTEPAATAIEPLTECMPLGVLAAYCVLVATGGSWLVARCFLLAHTVAWFVCDWLVYQSFRHAGEGGLVKWLPLYIAGRSPPSASGPPISFPLFTVAWLLREASSLPLYIAAVSGSVVDWRGRLYRVEWGGTAVEVEQGPRGEVRRKRQSKRVEWGRWIAGYVGNYVGGGWWDAVPPGQQGKDKEEDGQKVRVRRISGSPVQLRRRV
ncbi:hypothetical protein HDU93_009973 [Gonapodya sp. JEL0774]|nr:hypothetical protein HDU93_009973 [Gonapodya sp. JEL0774]